jgi:hypothetical protein
MTYQWKKDGRNLANGGNVSGATTSALTFTKASKKNKGSYTVVITNPYGKATSATASLSVLDAPVIAKSPASRTVKAGAKAVFKVKAKGGKPLVYQWFKNGTALVDGGNISGSKGKTLKISGVTAADAAVYYVVVSNLVGSVTSGNATLTVPGASSSDGEKSVSAASTIVPVIPPVISQIVKNENGGITLTCSGIADSVYILQATSDFANWTGISTNTADAGGLWQATDKADAPSRFYRIKSAP